MDSVIIQSQVNAINVFLTDFAAHHQATNLSHPTTFDNGNPAESYSFSLKYAHEFLMAQSNLLVAPVPVANCAPTPTIGCDTTSTVIYPNYTPMAVVGRGTTTTVYNIPETFNKVIKVGSPIDIVNEKDGIEMVSKGMRKYARMMDKQAPSPGVSKSRRKSKIRIPHVPRVRDFLDTDDERWEEYDKRMCNSSSEDELDDQDEAPAALILDRIHPFITGVRKQIVNKYYKDDAKAAVLADPENEHCLLRPLLGSKGDASNSKDDDDGSALPPLCNEETSLRNFPAHFPQLQNYLSTKALTHLVKQIAISYAVMHWAAKVDGRGVEFLLGMTCYGKTALHLLDLDEVRSLTSMTKDEVEYRLVPAAHGNEAYIPRPNISPDMWAVFEDTYCDASHNILKASKKNYKETDPGVFALPALFTSLLKRTFEEDEKFALDDSYIQFGSDTDEDANDQDADAKTGDEYADDSSDELPVFDEPKYASWADEMDDVDPITPAALPTIMEEEPKYASWADEMDDVDPIITPYIPPPAAKALLDPATLDPFYDGMVEATEAGDYERLDLEATDFTKPCRKLGKKTVRFAEWDNVVFEVPADEEARKIDPKYLRPQWREEDYDDEEEEEEDEDEEYEEEGEEYEEEDHEDYGAY